MSRRVLLNPGKFDNRLPGPTILENFSMNSVYLPRMRRRHEYRVWTVVCPLA